MHPLKVTKSDFHYVTRIRSGHDFYAQRLFQLFFLVSTPEVLGDSVWLSDSDNDANMINDEPVTSSFVASGIAVTEVIVLRDLTVTVTVVSDDCWSVMWPELLSGSCKPRLHHSNMLRATWLVACCARATISNMLLVGKLLPFFCWYGNMLRATSNLLQATSNLLPRNMLRWCKRGCSL